MGSRYLKNKHQRFCDFFKGWIEVYKRGAIAAVTLNKYLMSQRRLTELAPELTLGELDRRSYQEILNRYAVTHEKQTTLDFHRQLRSCILDAIDDGILTVDPTRKATIKGRVPADKKMKYLNCGELTALVKSLNLSSEANWDWFILLVAKTGLRFAEALAYVPGDLDVATGQIRVWRTWAYKAPAGGFAATKNTTSIRTVSIDPTLAEQLVALGTGRDPKQPLFVEGRVFNSQVNDRLAELCREARVPVISVHGLRHTHASALLHAGVSIASIAKRLGHANITTTQQTYLHIIRELEDKDNETVLRYLETLVK